MKTLIYLFFLLLISSCGNKNSEIMKPLNDDMDKVEDIPIPPKWARYDSVISALPSISDTAFLIKAIKEMYKLQTGENDGWDIQESIPICKIITVGKKSDALILLEYDFKEGSMADYPWKYQLFLLPKTSKLIKKSTFKSFKIVDFNAEKMILGINESGKGYGSHEILRYNYGGFINIFDHNHYLAENETYNPVSTVDRHSDDGYYPNPLTFTTKDLNHDGVTDVQFSGLRKMIMKKNLHGQWEECEPYLKQVKFNYIYNTSLGKFIPEEDYRKKYKDLY